MLKPPPPGSVDVTGLQRLSGPLTSPLGLFCSWKAEPISSPPTSSSSSRESLGLRLPLFLPPFHRTSLAADLSPEASAFDPGLFRCRKCLLFVEVEIIFLIKDRKTGEACVVPLKQGLALTMTRLKNNTIKGVFFGF